MDNRITPEYLSDAELNLLLLCYMFADQYGNVFVLSAFNFGQLHNIEIMSPEKMPQKISQQHVDILMDHGLVPDTRLLLNKIFLLSGHNPSDST